MSQKFEEHVRCLLATGTTARQTREGLLLNAGQFLKEDECSEYQSEIPVVEWFSKQREALGVESYLYTFMRIAGCETIQQWGFDETKIDGHDTLNQWAMLIDPSPLGNGKPSALFLFITLTLNHRLKRALTFSVGTTQEIYLLSGSIRYGSSLIQATIFPILICKRSFYRTGL